MKKRQNNKTPFFASRSSSECMNAAINWIRDNRRGLFRMMLYLLAPLCVIQTIGLSSLFEDMIGDSDMPMSSAMVTFGFSLIGFALLNGLLWTLMRWDIDHTESIDTLSLRDIARPLWRNTSRMFLVVFVVGGFCALLFISSLEILLVTPMLLILFVVLLLPLLYLGPAYTIDHIPFIQAIKRSYRLGIKNLGPLIVITLTLTVILLVLFIVSGMPLMLITSSIESLSRNISSVNSIWLPIFKTLRYICFIFTTFVGYYSTLLVMLSGGYLYGSAAQEFDDVSLLHDIENFENI